jgi:hypothetical protein
MRPVLFYVLAALCFTFSCGSKKECPGFSANLMPYIPDENRLVFRNPAGDSLVFNTPSFDFTPPRTEKQNVLSVGGTGSKPYCRSSCSLGPAAYWGEAQQLNYQIDVDNEALTCTLSVNITSQIPTVDYFQNSTVFATKGRLFGDTLRLGNFTPTTAPRFSKIEIVYGRGIISIRDDVKNCLWTR